MTISSSDSSNRALAETANQPNFPSVSMPHAVGPFPVYVFTDAQYFTTILKVNGVSIALKNARGEGFVSIDNHSASGPLGYPNHKMINLYLKPGNNDIEVTFELSSVVEKMQKEGELSKVDSPYYAFYVVQSSEAKFDFAYSYKRDDLVAAASKKSAGFKVLHQQTMTFERGKMPLKNIPLKFSLNIDGKNGWKAEQVESRECSWSISRPSGAKEGLEFGGSSVGKLYLNGELAFEVQSDSDQNVKFEPREGVNDFEYRVSSIGKIPEIISLELGCKMDDALEHVGSPNLLEEKSSSGEHFSERVLTVWEATLKKPGSYKGKFTYHGPITKLKPTTAVSKAEPTKVVTPPLAQGEAQLYAEIKKKYLSMGTTPQGAEQMIANLKKSYLILPEAQRIETLKTMLESLQN